jgi:hypothetical protein
MDPRRPLQPTSLSHRGHARVRIAVPAMESFVMAETADVGRSVHVALPPELAERFEAWRGRQKPTIPTTVAAVRRLLARALDADQHASA